VTPEELTKIGPWFRAGERYLNGTPVSWHAVSFPTMQALVQLRELLDSRILLIRGPHPDPDGTKPYKQTAIDACAPDVSLATVTMALFRLQGVSFGVYSGNSFHLDSRPFTTYPARWMALKTYEEPYLAEHQLQPLITSRADGWIYLAWSHPRSYEALTLVLSLARKQATPTAEV